MNIKFSKRTEKGFSHIYVAGRKYQKIWLAEKIAERIPEHVPGGGNMISYLKDSKLVQTPKGSLKLATGNETFFIVRLYAGERGVSNLTLKEGSATIVYDQYYRSPRGREGIDALAFITLPPNSKIILEGQRNNQRSGESPFVTLIFVTQNGDLFYKEIEMSFEDYREFIAEAE